MIYNFLVECWAIRQIPKKNGLSPGALRSHLT